MNTQKLGFLILSLPAATVLFPYSVANAALRVSNSSLMQNQIQVSAMAAQMQMEPQPARVVTNSNGEVLNVSPTTMDACSSIYPNGKFDWAVPTTGLKRGGDATCVSYVELRSYKNGSNSNYTVLATAYLAAGDSMKCNIDDFHDITPKGREFEYPADAAPTIEDVEKVMAQENKSNAGFKILAAAVVGGLGGNLVGKGEAGSDSPLGTNKEKLQSTAIGALGGAALMTASTQVNDYKAGSIILSTGVNAAAGAVAGNLMASGDDVLRIDKCQIYKNAKANDKGDVVEAKCLYGMLEVGGNDASDKLEDVPLFYNYTTKTSYLCTVDTENSKKWDNCQFVALKNIEFEGAAVAGCKADNIDVSEDCRTNLQKIDASRKYKNVESGTDKIMEGSGDYVKIKSATKIGSTTGAMIEVDDADAKKLFGYKYSDWAKELKGKLKNRPVYDLQGNKLGTAGTAVASAADTNGTTNTTTTAIDLDNFHPVSQSADDGAMVDFSNKARMKSTLIGTAGGAGLGALAGASGADAAIQERWIAATQEYKDSLQNIWCTTGERPLGPYNQLITIPNMQTPEE